MIQNSEAIRGKIDKFDCIKLYKNRKQHYKQSKKIKDRQTRENTTYIKKGLIWLEFLILKEVSKNRKNYLMS